MRPPNSQFCCTTVAVYRLLRRRKSPDRNRRSSSAPQPKHALRLAVILREGSKKAATATQTALWQEPGVGQAFATFACREIAA